VKMPSFFGYMLWSGAVLLPVFAVVTYFFCAPQTVGWSAVIAGLDPAIHLLTKGMDARVRPAHDAIENTAI